MSMMGHFLFLNNCSHFLPLAAESVPAVVAYGSTLIDGVGRFSFLNNCSHFSRAEKGGEPYGKHF
jgi:hypothetical protein